MVNVVTARMHIVQTTVQSTVQTQSAGVAISCDRSQHTKGTRPRKWPLDAQTGVK